MKPYYLAYSFIRFWLLSFTYLFRNIIPKIKSRFEFEEKNFLEKGAESFNVVNENAQATFFVSSEGELEQVKTLIYYYLKNNELIEIVFTSPSVENKILDLYNQYTSQIRYLRFPFLSWSQGFLASWLSSSKIICVRYDIFPEMLPIIINNKAVLVSATKSYEKYQSLWIRSYYQFCYNQFDMIVWADKIEVINQRAIHKVSDMRSFQIIDRLKDKEKIIDSKGLKSFIKHIKDQKISIIWGSFWLNEALAFNDFKKFKQKIVLAPHLLTEFNLDEINRNLTNKGLKVVLVDHSFDCHDEDIDVYILKTKGVLCEIYSFFDHAIVGGGHGKSIHSVLEPYLAGCMVWHGPVYFRSTEHNYIKNTNPKFIHVVSDLKSYFDQINQNSYHNRGLNYTSNEDRAIIEEIYRL